ncbi:MAG: glycosyltransferase family 2 protein [Chloroflexi bacterium]|nr:glycosyltransferase family 2 protein [Chloroflexota bacterium]
MRLQAALQSRAVARPAVIIAMPAYNEAMHVGSIVLMAKRFSDQVLVFDDGSTDNTAEIARLAGAKVISNGRRRGKGNAIQHILEEAKQRLPCTLVIMDADGQHDPREIPTLLAPIREGYDIVIGSRKIMRNKTPLYRRLGQKVLSYSTGVLTGKRLSDSECGFRALSKQAVAKIVLREDGFSTESELICKSAENGLQIVEVPISNIYVKDGSTLNPIEHGFKVLARILVMISERRPLFFFGLAAALALVLGSLAGARALSIFQGRGEVPVGLALVSGFFVNAAVQSLFTGLIIHILMKQKR